MQTSLLDSMTDTEIAQQMTRFRARVATGELERMHIAVGLIKRLDSSGDIEVYYPRVDVARLPALPDDMRVAVAVAERTIAEARATRQRLVGTTPGVGRAAPVTTFLPFSAPDTIVILNPIVGG